MRGHLILATRGTTDPNLNQSVSNIIDIVIWIWDAHWVLSLVGMEQGERIGTGL